MGREPVTRTPSSRTCVGCRARTTKSELLRVVLAGNDVQRVVPDERGRLAGRGAHLHPTQACLDRAERRRVFTRALRVSGPVDLSALRRYVERRHTDSTGEPSTTGGTERPDST